MKNIVYLNVAWGEPPKRENGNWEIEELDLTFPPTKCKVTINKSIIIPNVFDIYLCFIEKMLTFVELCVIYILWFSSLELGFDQENSR